MRRFPFILGLCLMAVATPASALDLKTTLKTKVTTTIKNLAAKVTKVEPPDLLPENCRREKVKSAGLVDWKTAYKDCTRTVCGPYFWDESAVDVCPTKEVVKRGKKPNQSVFKVVRVRHPKREFSNDPWFEVYLQTQGIEWSCGGISEWPNDWGRKTSLFQDIFIQDALAAWVLNPHPWLPEEKQQVAKLLAQVATRVEGEIQNPTSIYNSNLDVRTYTEIMIESSKWLAHSLDPQEYACPPRLLDLCQLVDPSFNISWAKLTCISERQCPEGTIYGLNKIFISEDLAISADEAHLPVVATAALHEAVHALNHSLDAGRGSAFERDTLALKPNQPLETYSDETTAYMAHVLFANTREVRDLLKIWIEKVPIIGPYFYTSHVRHWEYRTEFEWSSRGRLAALTEDPALARMAALPIFQLLQSTWNYLPSQVATRLYDQTRGMNNDQVYQLLDNAENRQLLASEAENRFKMNGGLVGLMGPPGGMTVPGSPQRTGAVMTALPKTALLSDAVESFACTEAEKSNPRSICFEAPLPEVSMGFPYRSGNSSDGIGRSENDSGWSAPTGRTSLTLGQLQDELEDQAAAAAKSAAEEKKSASGGSSGTGSSGSSGGSGEVPLACGYCIGTTASGGSFCGTCCNTGALNEYVPASACTGSGCCEWPSLNIPCFGVSGGDTGFYNYGDGVTDISNSGSAGVVGEPIPLSSGTSSKTGKETKSVSVPVPIGSCNSDGICYQQCECLVSASGSWTSCAPVAGGGTFECPEGLDDDVDGGPVERACGFTQCENTPEESWTGDWEISCWQVGRCENDCGVTSVTTTLPEECAGSGVTYQDWGMLQGMVVEGCGPYIGFVQCYDGPAGERCRPDPAGCNNACGQVCDDPNIYCGCPSDLAYGYQVGDYCWWPDVTDTWRYMYHYCSWQDAARTICGCYYVY